METKLIDREGYRFTVVKLPVVNPADTIQVTFVKELLDEEGVVEWASKFDMFLTQEEIDRLKAAL